MNFIVSKRIQPFLDPVSFTRLQQTTKKDYYSDELWNLYVKTRIPNLEFLENSKKAVAFHHIIKWALCLPIKPLTTQWFQAIVDWLQYKCSIYLIHNTIFRYDSSVFLKLHFDNLNSSQWFHWERLKHRYHRHHNDLYKLEKRYRYASWNTDHKRPLLCF